MTTTLLVASTGGHLKQLEQLADRLRGIPDRHLWVTFDTPQSRSLLADRDVVFGRFTHSRDALGAAANTHLAVRLMREREVGAIVSTGAAVAASFIVPGRARRVDCHYVESAARSLGPSLTGRVLRAVPGVRLYTQYPSWEGGPWRYRGSVFDGFEPAELTKPRAPIRRAVVTLGTIRFPFPRLARRLAALLPDDAEVLWQTGATEVDGGTRELPAAELQAAMREADIVVAHAGVGSALSALEAGHRPVLVPRRAAHGEHVDDHQQQVAEELERRGLAVSREAGALTFEDLEAAASRRATRADQPPPFRLGPA